LRRKIQGPNCTLNKLKTLVMKILLQTLLFSLYISTSGGMLTVTDNTTTMDAAFSFDAATTSGETISITAGVVTDLSKS